ncbi:alginate lyase family protein [Paenibacillus sp. FSL R5-0407]|uniref:alginate lyase family protein n=1 Tax=Paenibacillus sp. FSL R5-0407 TaxID=2975320 RepID=UPI0030FB4B6A
MNPAIRHDRVYFWESSDRSFIVDTCLSEWPEEAAEVLYRADLACRSTFIYTHRWDMERCETEVAFPDGINWSYRHNEDIEWMVMLNRARYMSELGQAYWLTGEERYAEAYISLMKDWIRQNPLTEEEVLASQSRAYNVKDTWRKLDSGIRIVNWLKGYYCVRQSSLWQSEEETLFREAVRRHGMYLNIAYTPHDRQSNWGFLETNGLFQLALMFPDIEESETWLKQAVQRLAEMCPVQVFEDGMHNEQCTMYHHEVLHCLFEPVWLAELNDVPLPPELRNSLDRMYSASLALVQPDGRQPMLGDSDGTDIRDVLTRGAVLFARGDLKVMGYDKLDYEGIWYYGEKGCKRYEQLHIEEPKVTSVELAQSGYYVMRTDWKPDARYLVFDAGHMDVIRAHGHDDLLHISLFAYGREFLTDPGRYTYMENDFRRYFKESLQHNTVAVDGETISKYVDSWNWNHVANPMDRFWRTETEIYDYVQASHDGYLRLNDPVLVRRQILFVKPDYWIVVDTCKSNGEHEYTLPFHFAEGLNVEVEADGTLLASSSRQEPALRIIPIKPGEALVDASWVARDYNHKVTSLKAMFRQKGSGLSKFVTVLYPCRTRDCDQPDISQIEVLDSYGDTVSEELVTALTIQNGAERVHALFSHQGPRGYQFAGRHITGEVLLVRENNTPWEEHEDTYIVKV